MKILQEKIRKISRPVQSRDVPKIIKIAEAMARQCGEPIGHWKRGGFALADPQIDQEDPMRFYVLKTGAIIINPEIVKHTNHKVVSKDEGCLSFSNRPPTDVERYRAIHLQFQTIVKDPINDQWMLGPEEIINLKGLEAFVAQHEIDHMDGKTIYD